MQALTTNQVADLCGVNRTTVGYWVRTGKIQARRSGKLYFIHENDLRLFLESSGQAIPPELARRSHQISDFPTVQPCWDFFKTNIADGRCDDCAASKNSAEPCFTYREGGVDCRDAKCLDCEYYRKYYLPRIKFVYQINLPAAVYRGTTIWGANSLFEALRGFDRGEVIGLGIERVVHQDSMEMAISNAKRRTMGDRSVPKHYQMDIRTREGDKTAVHLLVTPLNEPWGTFLAIFHPMVG
ncbi:MAG: helix-turn-helix domain-containing protein [Desulfobacteraceae bacterium]|nr:helix-turn-helix domain-containing protein [Desulfobacteraceae bacterium]